MPIGAEALPGGGAHFRVWAPVAQGVSVELLDANGSVALAQPLDAERLGYFSGTIPTARIGARYRYRLPQGSFPDPASRFQPEGPHGPSEIVDPVFAWTDLKWTGRAPRDLVLYELHLGTFTSEGTWRSAAAELGELARIGVTGIEVMPVAEFPGTFGWGYDGVDLFAPSHLYGPPADARAFVNRAHELGVMVILDVVYNHLGPDGCYVGEFSPDYFTTRYKCEWGEPLNFDGENSVPVREYFRTNARYWIDEFHFDGLRLDATQQIFDASPTHILAEITAAVHEAAPSRRTFVVAENEPQDTRLLHSREDGGYAIDAVWNDDFHHSATVAASGQTDAYYVDYRGTAQELLSAVKHGFLFQGQYSRWQRKRRGTPAFGISPERFVSFLQNHDQISNSLQGLRLHQIASPGVTRALTALVLLPPWIPMLFQGQEFAASSPFIYFADHKPELASLVANGRRSFLEQFRGVAAPDAAGALPDPGQRESFLRCKLDFQDRVRHRPAYLMHEHLLRLRREQAAIREPARIDGAVLSSDAFVVRFFAKDGGDALFIVNLGSELQLMPTPEPLLAPIEGRGWQLLWSSESPEYGGSGTPEPETSAGWIVPGRTAVLLSPHARRELPRAKLSQKD